MTVKFWYHLVERLVDQEKAVRHRLRDTYTPHLLSLMETLRHKVVYPEEGFEDEEEQGLFTGASICMHVFRQPSSHG